MQSSSRTRVPLGARARLARGLLAVASVAAASLAAAPAAHAADDFLQISLDGTTYGSSASGSVFADGVLMVPGATTTGSIWVRNTGSEQAFLTAAAVSTAMDAELSGYLAVGSTGLGTFPTGTALTGAAGTCTELELALAVPAGGTRRIELAAGLLPETPNAAMSKQGSFDILFLLDSAGAGRPACDALTAPERPIELPSLGTGPGQFNAAPPIAVSGASTAFVAGTPAAAPATPGGGGAAAVPRSGGAERSGNTGSPDGIAPASFIESTVEPIIRTWQGTLMVLLSAAFFAAAAVRTRVTRRTS
ncbi:hypothetical protein [Arthrobacter sp.]|uniref:hypothetical protein n=1 Tax=Arthrobacter sp. TaxID=1667 RepID=UPI00289AF793|nr:hypothetical protein [Arthrobacter sp.]